MQAQTGDNPADSSTESSQITTLHTTTRLVVLDAVVNDGSGHPILGLKASDFALTEDGVPQTIFGFTEQDATTSEQPQSDELPVNTFSVKAPSFGNGAVTVIVLDGFAPHTRDQLRDYFSTAVLTMPVAIFRLDWQGMHLVQGFTSDRNVLVEAANSKRIWPPLGFRVRYAYAEGTPTQHLAAYLATIPARINLVWVGPVRGAFDERKLISDDFETRDAKTPAEQIERSLPSVPRAMAGAFNLIGDLKNSAEVKRLSRVALFAIKTDGVAIPPEYNLSFGGLDPYSRPPGQGSFVTGADALFAQADLEDLVAGQGGRAFFFSEVKNALGQILATGSHYYTISYRPTNSKWDGAFRKIHIEVPDLVKAQRPFRISQLLLGWADDLEPQLMYRTGYYADATPRDRASVSAERPISGHVRAEQRSPAKLTGLTPGEEERIKAAMVFASPTPDQIHFTAVITPSAQTEKKKGTLAPNNFLAGPFAGNSYRNYRVHYWIDPRDLHFARTASGVYRIDLRFVVVVYRDDGVAANSLATSAHIEVTGDQLPELMISGVTADQTIALPLAGSFFLRSGVHEINTNLVGALEIPSEWIKLVARDLLSGSAQSATEPPRLGVN